MANEKRSCGDKRQKRARRFWNNASIDRGERWQGKLVNPPIIRATVAIFDPLDRQSRERNVVVDPDEDRRAVSYRYGRAGNKFCRRQRAGALGEVELSVVNERAGSRVSDPNLKVVGRATAVVMQIAHEETGEVYRLCEIEDNVVREATTGGWKFEPIAAVSDIRGRSSVVSADIERSRRVRSGERLTACARIVKGQGGIAGTRRTFEALTINRSPNGSYPLRLNRARSGALAKVDVRSSNGMDDGRLSGSG